MHVGFVVTHLLTISKINPSVRSLRLCTKQCLVSWAPTVGNESIETLSHSFIIPVSLLINHHASPDHTLLDARFVANGDDPTAAESIPLSIPSRGSSKNGKCSASLEPTRALAYSPTALATAWIPLARNTIQLARS